MLTKSEARELLEARREFNPLVGLTKLPEGEVSKEYLVAAAGNWDKLAYNDLHGDVVSAGTYDKLAK
jgi:hypothetical protein